MIPILAQVEARDAVTTLGGIGIAVFSMVIKDIVRDRLSGKNEKLKFTELAQQTLHLQRLVELARKSRKQTKRASKKINRKLGFIHKDVVIVKTQTAEKHT